MNLKYSQLSKLITGSLLLGVCAISQAATITVVITNDNEIDDGQCTLREAILSANNDNSANLDCVHGSGADEIVFSGGLGLPATFVLSSALPTITETLTISGLSASYPAGATPADTVIDGGGTVRLLTLAGASGRTLTLNGLTLSNGYTAVTGSSVGAAITVSSPSSLTLENVVVSNNTTTGSAGNAIFFIGDPASTLQISNSLFDGNSGGTIAANGGATVNINASTFTTNTDGGAIGLSSPGPVTINNSTFSNNTDSTYGGAISITSTDTFTLSNSTFSGNQLTNPADTYAYGGGVYVSGAAQLNWSNLTFSGNRINRTSQTLVGGSAFSATASTGSITNITVASNKTDVPSLANGDAVRLPATGVTVSNSVIANNAPLNCGNVLDAAYDGGFNLESGTDCGFAKGTQSTDPMLKALADNGGPVMTMAPSFGSPLIDGGNSSVGCNDHYGAPVATDARGKARVDGDDVDSTVTCDIGAYEFGGTGAVAILVNTGLGSDPSGNIEENDFDGHIYYRLQRYGNLQPFTTPVQTVDGTAIADLDYLAVSYSPAWTQDKEESANGVMILSDLNAESHESFTIEVSSDLPGVDVADPLTVTIKEPVISFSAATGSSATKDESAGTHTVTLELDSAYSQDVNVTVTLGGNATSGSDFSFGTALSIPAGQTSESFTINIYEDSYDEIDEEVIITLDPPADFGTLGAITSHALTIADNDTTPTGDYLPNPASVDEDPDSALQITLSATDADGDSGTDYTVTTGPAHGTLSGTGAVLDYTPDANYHGSDSFKFTVSDTFNTSTEVTVNITVNPVSDAPVITSSSTADAAENQTAVMTVTADDLDGDAVSFSITGGADSSLFDITSAGTLSFKSAPDFEAKLDANEDGIYEVDVTATDDSASTLTDVQTVFVTVTNVSEALVGSVTIDGTIQEDATLIANTSSLSDGDGLGTFDYQWQSGGVDVGTNSNSYVPGDSDVGKAISVTVSYTDGNGTLESVTSAITSNVVNINDAPVIAGTPPTTILKGVLYSFTPAASDVDVGDILTFSGSNIPAWMNLNSTSGELSGTATQAEAGVYADITITITDGSFASNSLAAFTLTVEGDLDSDGIADGSDTDVDGDSVDNASDAFPLDASETVDTDGDGTGNNADTDDDGDGVDDVDDAFPLDPAKSADVSSSGGGGGGGSMSWLLLAFPLLMSCRRRSNLNTISFS